MKGRLLRALVPCMVMLVVLLSACSIASADEKNIPFDLNAAVEIQDGDDLRNYIQQGTADLIYQGMWLHIRDEGGGAGSYYFNIYYSEDKGKHWEKSDITRYVSGCTALELYGGKVFCCDYLNFDPAGRIWINTIKNGDEREVLFVEDTGRYDFNAVLKSHTNIYSFRPAIGNVDLDNNSFTVAYRLDYDAKPFCRVTFSIDPLEVINVYTDYDLEDYGRAYLRSGRFFENSNSEYLDETEVRVHYMLECMLNTNKYYVLNDLRYAINEIYAAKGYDFTGTDYEDYFADKSWYHPVNGKTISEEELQPWEKANIDLLVQIEKEIKLFMSYGMDSVG